MAILDPAADALLAIRAVSLRLGGRQILDDVGFDVRDGEIVGLLGDSGSGKSTLLRVVAGLAVPDAGEIRLDGRSLLGSPPELRGIGLMFQDYALFPHLTVLDNVRFGLSRRPAAEAAAIVRARLAQVGLTDRAASYPATLSGGEAQRVALVRALAPEPRLLLLDEPFSNLDRRMRDRMRGETLALLRATGTAALLVTHDPVEALETCDRIVLMRAGRIVQVGTGEALFSAPTCPFVARFFGEVVTLAGTCHEGRLQTPLGPLPLSGVAEGAPVTACLRPGAFTILPPDSERPNAIAGSVQARAFLGERARLDVAVAGLEAPIGLPVPLSDPRRPGDAVRLALTGSGMFIFSGDVD